MLKPFTITSRSAAALITTFPSSSKPKNPANPCIVGVREGIKVVNGIPVVVGGGGDVGGTLHACWRVSTVD